ncbi:hypothetical protein CTA1_12412 [Colletotrichum tanaceti]|uniref:PDZ domain-containing protein n=1 Tax=Colletotrichum tanaceti TaxID=1306861 RepID=A0A4U6XDR5_9PEZI|nr:hypothetical protein CTA1_12412 [Colletotrichum tanaceti]
MTRGRGVGSPVDDPERLRLGGVVLLELGRVAEDAQGLDDELVLAGGRIAAVVHLAVPVDGEDAAGDVQGREGPGLADGLDAPDLLGGVWGAGGQGHEVGADKGGAEGHVDGEGREDGLGLVGGARGRQDVGVVAGDGLVLLVLCAGRGGHEGLVERDVAVEAAADADVRQGQAGAVGAVEGDVAGPDGQAAGVEGRGGRGHEDGGLAAGGDGDLALAQADGGVLGRQVVGEGGREQVAGGGEGVGGGGADVAQVVRDGRGARVGDGEVQLGDEVVRVVEREAGDAEEGGGVGGVVGLDEARALLGDGGQELVGPGAVVELDGVGVGGEQVLDGGGVQGLADLGDEGHDTGGLGAGHRGSGEDGVGAEGPGVQGEDVASDGAELGLLVGVPVGAPGAEAGDGAAGGGVGGLGEDLLGLGGVGHLEGDPGAGGEGLEPDGGLGGRGHADGEDLGDAGDGDGAGAGRVVVEHEVLGTGGGGVLGLGHKGAGSSPDEDDLAAQVGRAGRVRVAAEGDGGGGVGARGPEGQLDAGPVVGLAGGVGEQARGAAGDGEGVLDEDGRGEGVVEGGDGRDVPAAGGGGGEEDALVARVTGRDGAGHAGLDDPRDGGGPGLVGPARGAADRGGNDVAAVLVRAVVGGDQDVVADLAIAAKDLWEEKRACQRMIQRKEKKEVPTFVSGHSGITGDGFGNSAQGDTRGGSKEPKGVGLGGDDAGNVGAVAAAVHGVRVGEVVVEAVVGVADEVGAVADEALRAEAAAEGRVEVVDAGVDDGDLDALAGDAVAVQPVDLGLDVGREGVVAELALPQVDVVAALRAGPDDLGLGDAVGADGPDVLDRGEAGELGRLGVGRVEVLELDGGALEEGVVELHARGGLGVGLGVEVGRILFLHGTGQHSFLFLIASL